ncbi:hypothetical protein OC845_002110 [Tilletia horrida]|nr:hypothetical protein OC845_002110 [Tilletia horrida]
MSVGSRRVAGREAADLDIGPTYDTQSRELPPSLGLCLPSYLGRDSTFSASFESAYQARSSMIPDQTPTTPVHATSDTIAQIRATPPRKQPGLDVTSFFDFMEQSDSVDGSTDNEITLGTPVDPHASLRQSGKPVLERQPVITRSATRPRPSQSSLRTITITEAENVRGAVPPMDESRPESDATGKRKRVVDGHRSPKEHEGLQVKIEHHSRALFQSPIFERMSRPSASYKGAIRPSTSESSKNAPRTLRTTPSSSSSGHHRRASSASAETPRPSSPLTTKQPDSFVPATGKRHFDLMSRFRASPLLRDNTPADARGSRLSTASDCINNETLAAAFSLGSNPDRGSSSTIDKKSSQDEENNHLPGAEVGKSRASITAARRYSANTETGVRGIEEHRRQKSQSSSPRTSRDLNGAYRHSLHRRETMMEKALEEFQNSQLRRLNASNLRDGHATRSPRHLEAASSKSVSPAVSAQSAPAKSLHNPPLSGPPMAPLPPLPSAPYRSSRPSTADQIPKHLSDSSPTMFPTPPLRGEPNSTPSSATSKNLEMTQSDDPFQSGRAGSPFESNADIIDQIDLMIMHNSFSKERSPVDQRRQSPRNTPPRPTRRKSVSVDITFSNERADGSPSPSLRKQRQKPARPLLLTTMPPLEPLPALPATPPCPPSYTMGASSHRGVEAKSSAMRNGSSTPKPSDKKCSKVVKIVTPTRTSSLASSPSRYSSSNESAHEMLNSWRESGTLPSQGALEWPEILRLTASYSQNLERRVDHVEEPEFRFQPPRKRTGVNCRQEKVTKVTTESGAENAPLLLPSQLVRRRRMPTPPSPDKPLPTIQHEAPGDVSNGGSPRLSPSARGAPSVSSTASSRSFLIWPPSPVSPPTQRLRSPSSAGSAPSLAVTEPAQSARASSSQKQRKKQKQKKPEAAKKVPSVEQGYMSLGSVSFMSRI